MATTTDEVSIAGPAGAGVLQSLQSLQSLQGLHCGRFAMPSPLGRFVRRLAGPLLGLAVAASWPLAARADLASQADQIHLGVQDHAMPFSYRVDNGYAGYTVDLCLQVVAALEARRGKPFTNPPAQRWVSVSSQTRLMRLLAGDIDLECSSTSMTPARQQLGLAFSMPIFISDVGVLLRPGAQGVPVSAEQWLAQLRARAAVVVTTEGSTSVRHLARLNRQNAGTPFKVVYGRDHADSLRLLLDGAAEAFVMDRALLAALWARTPQLRAADLALAPWSPVPAETETYGIVLRDNDDMLKGVVRDTLCGLLWPGGAAQTGLQQLYARWFLQPLPGAAVAPGAGPGPGTALARAGATPAGTAAALPAGEVAALALAMHPELQRRLAAPSMADCP